MKLEILFNDLLKTNLNKEFKKSLMDSDYKLKSNIIYLTDQCNIECDYCYQLEERKNNKTFIKKEDIDIFFKNLLEREPELTSTVVLFGGEPFLNTEIIEYIFDLTDSITIEKGKKFNLSMTTNGLLIPKNLHIIERIKTLKNHFSLEISYDGIGNHRRKYKNGLSTTEEVEKIIKSLIDIIPISIRYTIHKDNYKDCIKDFIKLSKLNIRKIIVNFFEQELENFINIQEFKNDLKLKTLVLFDHFKKPICFLNCEKCQGCNFELFDGIYYKYNKNEYDYKSKNVFKFDKY